MTGGAASSQKKQELTGAVISRGAGIKDMIEDAMLISARLCYRKKSSPQRVHSHTSSCEAKQCQHAHNE